MRKPKAHGKSTSLDILGLPGPEKIPRKWSDLYKRLIALREEFLRGKTAHTKSAREELAWSTEHIADAATDSYDRDCALALLSSTQNALYEIDQAIKRMKDGTYGICELTQGPIEPERLKAIPWTRHSIAAQADLEERRGAARVKLGQLGTLVHQGSDGEDREEIAAPEAEREAA